MAVKNKWQVPTTENNKNTGGAYGNGNSSVPPLGAGGTISATGGTSGTYGSVLNNGTSFEPVYQDAINNNVVGGFDATKHLNGGVKETNYSYTGGTTTTDTEEKPTITYEEYIAEQKRIEEEKRQQAYKEAENYKERAAVDAQASYMQNMSTYGVNAENMAQMGLTGGGYSDYLNAQAYAQKRSDLQAADRNELALKKQADTTYADGIAALNKDMFAYQETQEQNKKAAYNNLLGYAMDANSGLSEENIRTMGASAGLSEEEIQTIISTWNSTEEKAKGEYSTGIKLSAYEMIETNGGTTTEYINGLKGTGVTDEDIADIIAYNQRYHYNGYKSLITSGKTVNTSDIDTAYNDGRLSKEQYDELKTLISNSKTDSIKNNINATGATSESIQASIDNADKLYKNGEITQAQYQSVYKDFSLKAINGVGNISQYQGVLDELDEYKTAGKISESDYNELIKTLKETKTKHAKWCYTVKYDSEMLEETEDLTIIMDGKEYEFKSGGYVEEESLKNLLNEVATGDSDTAPPLRTVVVVGGRIYIYRQWAGFSIDKYKTAHWHECAGDSDSIEDIVAAYMKL